MRAGQLRHRLRYEEPALTADAWGQMQEAWNTVSALVYGNVRSPRGSETYQAGRLMAKVDHMIEIRYPPFPVRQTGRFIDLDAQAGTTGIYNVVAAVDEEGRKREMKVFAIEVVGATDSANL
jgi:head-tail adaptor